jgi:hypothetical protein
MTPEQKTALIDACERQDEVRAVTIALQIAAKAARDKKNDAAVAIRDLIDAHKSRDQVAKEYRQLRLTVATQIASGMMANGNCRAPTTSAGHENLSEYAVGMADALIHVNAECVVPGVRGARHAD